MMKRFTISDVGKVINPSSPQAQGLIGFWPLNYGGGRVAMDLMGRRHGALTNFPTNPWALSLIGMALTFDGTDDYVANCEIGNEFAFANTTFSVSVWFKSTVGGMLCAKDGSSPTGKGWFVYVETSTGIINIQFKGSAGNAFTATTSGTSFIDGKWHHLVSIITTSTTNLNNNNSIVYVDGVNRSMTYTRTSTYESPTVAFTLGKRNGTLPFNGSIADFRIYNRALSAEQAQDLYINPMGIYQKRRIILEVEPSGTTNYELTANNITGSAPILGTPELTQEHSLIANNISASAPTLGTPALSQNHACTANNISASAPLLGSPTLSSTGDLQADSVTASSPTLGTPVLSQNHNLNPNSIASGSAILSTPALTQNHVLMATNIISAAPVLSTPTLTIYEGGGGTSYTPEEIADAVRAELSPELDRLNELHAIQGLDASKPMTVTHSSRVAGDINLVISGDGETSTTVTRSV